MSKLICSMLAGSAVMRLFDTRLPSKRSAGRTLVKDKGVPLTMSENNS